MANFNLISDLYDRLLISHITNKEILNDILQNKSIALYCGFDPTSHSLHIGHLLLLVTLKRFQLAGHKPVILIGGATSLIGDPSFKSEERLKSEYDDIVIWTENIKKQIKLFLNFDSGENSALILNNKNWFDKINVLSFLRDIGKNFSINSMINRESVKQRIIRSDQGISFSEFSYSLLQAYDFFLLNKEYKVSLQIGGSDQWGNISSGMHLINRLSQKQVYGITLPLLIQKNGIKFGKTESGAIWLDPHKTSPYRFYQFWMNIDDKDIYNFLRFFTFKKVSEINVREQEKNNYNNIIEDKRLLARHMTRLVHGNENLLAAERITSVLFFKNIHLMTKSDFKQLALDGMPVIFIDYVRDLEEALVLCGLSESRTQSKNMILANSILVNMKKVACQKYIFNNHDKLFDQFTLLTRGKKNHCLMCWKHII